MKRKIIRNSSRVGSPTVTMLFLAFASCAGWVGKADVREDPVHGSGGGSHGTGGFNGTGASNGTGGFDAAGGSSGTGGSTGGSGGLGTWTGATPIENAPSPRSWQLAVWTGSEMLIWGGILGSSGPQTNTGGRFNPATNRWTPTSTSQSPAARYAFSGVWTGREMIIFGGGSPAVSEGRRYAPASDTWRPTTMTGAPKRTAHSAVWTGREMIVWGGMDETGNYVDSGDAYDPDTDRWRSLSTEGAPSPRGHASMFWTGEKVIVWGGYTSSCAGSECAVPYNTGGIYDPATNRWSPISTTGAPTERRSYASAWTGKRMIIYGGPNLNRGALYDPSTNAWSAMTTVGAPSPLNQPSRGVWTGREFLVVGSTNDALLAAAYNPDTNAWAILPSLNPSNYRAEPSLVWSGNEAIIWGGYRYTEQGGYMFLNSGAKLHR